MLRYLIGLVVVAASPSLAADQNGSFAIKGAGLQSCAAFVQAYDEKTADLPLYVGWVDGFLTGLNQFREGTFDAAPWQTTETMIALTREICAAQSEEQRVIDAFNALVRDFRPLQLTEHSGIQALRTGDQTVAVYETVMQRVEAVLQRDGFEPGDVDGVFDQASSDALKAFQASRSLPQSGLPDQQTLFNLFVQNSSSGQN